VTPAARPDETPRAELLHGATELHRTVDRLAAEIAGTAGTDVVLVAVLKGSLLFVADLARAIDRRSVPGPGESASGRGGPLVDFLAISSYRPGQVRVRMEKDLDVDIAGRPVVLVEDIVDTALTLAYLRETLERRRPASLSVCTLFDKSARRILPVPLDHVGFEAPDRFLLGYGLDYRGRYRNLPFVAAGDHDLLRADPDRYVRQLYAPGAGVSPRRTG
jgi:hypoxanthine phosphoribosyltransferase